MGNNNGGINVDMEKDGAMMDNIRTIEVLKSYGVSGVEEIRKAIGDRRGHMLRSARYSVIDGRAYRATRYLDELENLEKNLDENMIVVFTSEDFNRACKAAKNMRQVHDVVISDEEFFTVATIYMFKNLTPEIEQMVENMRAKWYNQDEKIERIASSGCDLGEDFNDDTDDENWFVEEQEIPRWGSDEDPYVTNPQESYEQESSDFDWGEEAKIIESQRIEIEERILFEQMKVIFFHSL